MRSTPTVVHSSRNGRFPFQVRSLAGPALIAGLLAACSYAPYTAPDTEMVVEYLQFAPQALDTTEVKKLDGATVADTISLYVRDNPRLTEVRFHLDDPDQAAAPHHVDDEAPFTMDLDTRELSDGEHSLTVSGSVSRGSALIDTHHFTVANGEASADPPEAIDETGSEGTTDPAAGDEGDEGDDHAHDDSDVDDDAGDEEPAIGSDGDAGDDDAGESDGSADDEPAIGSDGEVLSWAPPILDDPVTLTIRQSSSLVILNLDDRTDYIIDMPDEPLRAGIKVNGGRNIVLIGGEIAIPWQGENATITQRTGLKIHGVKGTMHVEGLLIHGDDVSEGIQISAPAGIIQIQNVGVFGIHARDQVDFTDNHPDIIQTYGNVGALRVDRLTGTTDYQGLFLKTDFNGPHGPITLKRVNVIGEATSRYLMWVRPEAGHGDVVIEDVWLDVHENRSGGMGSSVWPNTRASDPERLEVGTDAGGTYAWWPQLEEPLVQGALREGRPPAGTFVQRETVGLAYTSPGYADGGVIMAAR